MEILRVIKRVFRVLQFNYREIILFELIYRILFAVCVVSINTRLFSFALKKAGYSYLTAKNLPGFLLYPWSLAVLGIVLLFLAVYTLFELCVLFAAFQASEYGERLKLRHLLVRGWKCFYSIINRNQFSCMALMIVWTLASGMFYLYPAAERIKAIKDIMKNLKNVPAAFFGLQIGFYLIVCYNIPKLFSIPFVILNKKDWKEAKQYSYQFWKKHPFFITGLFFFLCIFMIIVSRYLLYIGTLIAAWLINSFVDKSIQLAMVLTVFDWLQLAVMVLGSIGMSFFGIACLTGMYYYYREEYQLEPEPVLIQEAGNRQYKNKRWTAKILAGVIGGLILFFLLDVISNGVYYAKKIFPEIQITAHRGSSKEAPENTMPAFELAIAQMADYIELDVQETSDGEIIVLHDKSFKRTTGINLSPWNIDYKAVQSLDAGAYMGEEFIGTKIPTLEEVIQLCEDSTMLNIELKNNGHDDDLVEDVLALIEEYHFENQCVITSTSLMYLKQVKEQNPDLETGYILSTAYGSFYDNDAVDFFSVSSGLLNEKIVKLIHESGHEVHAWTVNSKTELERMKLLGVDNVITDYPVLAREILYREEDTEGIMEYVRLMLER